MAFYMLELAVSCGSWKDILPITALRMNLCAVFWIVFVVLEECLVSLLAAPEVVVL